MNLSHFLQMGHYGIYVWPAYGITLFIFFSNILAVLVERKKINKQIKKQFCNIKQIKKKPIPLTVKFNEPETTL